MSVNKVLPAVVTLADLGSVKIDAFPISDAETTLSANEHNYIAANTAILSSLSPIAIIHIEINSGVAVIKHALCSWVSPIPTVIREDVGLYSITFPSSVGDILKATGSTEYQLSDHSINIRFCEGSFSYDDGSDSVTSSCYRQSANVISFRTNYSDSPTDVSWGNAVIKIW